MCEETFGLSLVEAFATATAVVASDLGGTSEIVTRDVGRLFPSGDAASLAKHLRFFADNVPEPARMGAAARARWGDLYRPAANLETLESVYSSAMRLPVCASSRP